MSAYASPVFIAEVVQGLGGWGGVGKGELHNVSQIKLIDLLLLGKKKKMPARDVSS